MNEEQYIGFENYLNNDMPSDEINSFEERLKSDTEFRNSFELYKETTQFLSTKFSADTIDFKENLKSVSKDYFAENTKSKSKVIAFRPFYFAIAASVAIAFGAWFMMQQNPIYSDYSQHEKAMFTERGEVIKNLKLAEKSFNEKNYKEAVVNFELVLKEYNRPEINYFYAISLIEINEFIKAQTVLNQLKTGKSVYREKAIWQLALSNLKQKKYDDCKVYLKQLSSDSEDYEKAQKLLKELE